MLRVTSMLNLLWYRKMFFSVCCRSLLLVVVLALTSSLAMGAEQANRLLSIGVDPQSQSPTVLIATQEPVGYRYTVYDSEDPLRVVIDFPGMLTGDVAEVIPGGVGAVREIKASQFDLSAGGLTRVEIMLEHKADYQVSLEEKSFQIAFEGLSGVMGDSQHAPMTSKVEEKVSPEAQPVDLSQPAASMLTVDISPGAAALTANGRIEKFKYFPLSKPERLVVDVYGVKPVFKERAFPAAQGVKQVRAGVSADKTRFVFDASGDRFPEYLVENQQTQILVRWGALAKQSSSRPEETAKPAENMEVAVKEETKTSTEQSAQIASEPVVAKNDAADQMADVEIANEADTVSKESPIIKVDQPPVVVEEQSMAAVGAGEQSDVEEQDDHDAKPLGMADQMAAEAEKYSGEKISLVFDNAEVRSILQLIGEISGYNIVAPSVADQKITLRLIDVPWDYALQLVLDTAGLEMRQEAGTVMKILTKAEVAAERNAMLKAKAEALKEGPLSERTLVVNYSAVGGIVAQLEKLKSERGQIIPVPENKMIIAKDVPDILDTMEEIIRKIDIPHRQVLIEARIVEATTTFARDLGVKWNFDYTNDTTNGVSSVDNASVGLGGAFLIPTANPASAGLASAIAFGGLDDSINIDLRLSALETSGEGRIVSTPRVATLNGKKAAISQGTQIPYSSAGDSGTSTEFKDAKLALDVTPEINPDGTILLEITASNSAPGSVVPTATGNAVAIDTKEAKTNVMVRNGQTTVIGGIFVESESEGVSGVPILKNIPILGTLFKSTTRSRERRELLIFITPRILEI